MKLTFLISFLMTSVAWANIGPANSEKPSTTFESNTMQQQKKQISGTVVDSDGNPIPGVSVILKGTNTGITTGINGEFQLEIPADAQILVFSFVGMKSQEVSVTGKTVINVTMQAETIGLAV